MTYHLRVVHVLSCYRASKGKKLRPRDALCFTYRKQLLMTPKVPDVTINMFPRKLESHMQRPCEVYEFAEITSSLLNLTVLLWTSSKKAFRKTQQGRNQWNMLNNTYQQTSSFIKMAVFWVVAPCRLIALMMEAARTSETLVQLYQTTWCYNPEDSHLHTHRRENLKSYFIIYTLHTTSWSSWVDGRKKKCFQMSGGEVCCEAAIDKTEKEPGAHKESLRFKCRATGQCYQTHVEYQWFLWL
jgi:hypothetical protein